MLSSNQISFTSDARFSVIHPQDSDDFNLQIKFVQKRDAGKILSELILLEL